MPRSEGVVNRVVNLYHRIFSSRTYPQTQVGPKLSVANLLGGMTNIGEALRQVNAQFRNEAGNAFGAYNKYFLRQSAADGELGSLVRIKGGAGNVAVVGDLHGNVSRLNLILEEFGPKLKSGELSLVFNGDLIHQEKPENLDKMESSRQLLDAVIELKRQFPNQVHIIPGDHTIGLGEFTAAERGKIIEHIYNNDSQDGVRLLGGIIRLLGNVPNGSPLMVGKQKVANDPKTYVPQTVEFLKALISDYKKQNKSLAEIAQLIEGYQRFFDNCPQEVVVQMKDSVTFIAHSAIPNDRFPTTAEMVEAKKNPSLLRQLNWNKFSETPDPKKDQYGPSAILGAINSLAQQFGVAPSKVFIFSGHDKRSSWAYAPYDKAPNYQVIHANNDGAFGVGLIGEQLVREKIHAPKGLVPDAMVYRMGIDRNGVPTALPEAA